MKKIFTLYLALSVMAFCAVLFTSTLVDATITIPPDSVANVAIADVNIYAAPLPVNIPRPIPAPTSTLPNYPSQFVIPSLHIDAHVQLAGVTAKGNMGTPTNYTDVAWYKYGVIPGNVGTAVIDGHLDNALALAGVFKHLVDVQNGADIYITTVAGTTLHFVVASTTVYDYRTVPLAAILNNHVGSQLSLITCGGTWLPREKIYDKRVVVTAVLVQQ